MINKVLIKQLELFIAYMKKLTPQDFCDLESGTAKISFSMQNVSDDDSIIGGVAYDQFVQELLSLTSREQCFNYFDKHNFQKKELEGILSCLGVTFNKKDNKNKLQSKIIENTIGKKLRTDAIINK